MIQSFSIYSPSTQDRLEIFTSNTLEALALAHQKDYYDAIIL